MRLRINVNGRVQGVGFRPTVYKYAREKKLSGWVENSSNGIIIEVEGEKTDIYDFVNKLESCPPPQALVKEITKTDLPVRNEDGFRIIPSIEDSKIETEVSPDIATCSECLSELLNPQDRRYLYPFINCTDCGPRFTIVKNIPYDRQKTTMDKFTMCPECGEEYHSPVSRRFHAQPTACPDCGPQVSLVQTSDPKKPQPSGEEAVRKAIKLLQDGKIVAIKGLGGFHLACDARNGEAVRNLRKSKDRENKPFALMAKNLEVIKQFCEVSPEEEQLLLSPKCPIVLLKRIENSELRIKNSKTKEISLNVSPNNRYLGVMLPYTPLHYLLFNSQLYALVMTSGNFSDEPIVYENDAAIARLKGIADFLLVHNRDIFIQCDDSVTRVFPTTGDEIIMRRARSYVPEPIKLRGLDSSEGTTVLATGAHLKNTFCLAKGDQFIISQHIGDLENYETFKAFENSIEHFKRLFKITPAVVACDLHPGYLATKYAMEIAEEVPIQIQHHHAHIASCMADNDLENRKVIGVAFDGTGYGSDGTLWGAEFLVSDYNEFERAAHLRYIRLPGGEAAIREPWRIAAGLLYETYGEGFCGLDMDFTRQLNKENWLVLKGMLDKGINCPRASSMGRLFDSISALVGLKKEITYEGEAAIELEMAIESVHPVRNIKSPRRECKISNGVQSYKYGIERIRNAYTIDFIPIIKGVVEDLQMTLPVSVISEKFHNTIAEMTVETCKKIRSDTHNKLNEVALSGGVFQNMFLLTKTYNDLTGDGFKVYIHRRVPPNDGGISLGQAVIANSRIKN